MEWTKTTELTAVIKANFMDEKLEISYTQWEDDDLDADESVTQLTGSLVDIEISTNSFQGIDICFHIKTNDQQETIEILMDFPPDDEDIVAQLIRDTTLQIFGNESTLTFKKGH